mgnify:CR=1 FL=1
MGWKIRDSYSEDENNKMIFSETKLKGVLVIELEKNHDERGFFTRSWDKDIFETNGCDSTPIEFIPIFSLSRTPVPAIKNMVYPRLTTKSQSFI